MKIGELSPIIGWLVGVAVAVVAFAVAGVPILFAAAYSAGHQPSDEVSSKLIALAVMLAVTGCFIGIAWAIRRFISRA